MKKELLTVKELAAELRVSPKSIHRAYCKGGRSPCSGWVAWLGSISRSPASDGMERTRPHASSQRQLDTAGRAGRRQPAARSEEKPPLGKRGAISNHLPRGRHERLDLYGWFRFTVQDSTVYDTGKSAGLEN